MKSLMHLLSSLAFSVASCIPAMATSPPQPPPISKERAILASSAILVLKGIRIHWIVRTSDPSSRELTMRMLDSPSAGTLGHSGPILLEAEIVKRLVCTKACGEGARIFVRLDGAMGVPGELSHLLNTPQIFLLKDPHPVIVKAYPPQVQNGWHMNTADRNTYLLPLSSESLVFEVLSKSKSK